MNAMTIGIDLGDRHSHVCVLGPDGQVVGREAVPSTRAGLQAVLERFAGARVTMEVGGHSRWASALAQELGHEVIVANPSYVRLIYAGLSKSDRYDAEALARLARLDPALLHGVRHRGRSAQAALAIVRARDLLVRARADAINHVRMVVKNDGARIKSCDADQFVKHARSQVPDAFSLALSPLLDVIEQYTARIRQYDALIARVARMRFPETERLLQVGGVGPITALTFVLTLEDPTRFQDARSVGPYLGLVPKRHQSGDSDPKLRISKAGDAHLRRLLVNCAHYITGPFGVDSDLRRYGHRLAPPGSKVRKKRAIVAVARKLAVLLLRLWQTGARYEPLRQAAASPSPM